LIRTLFFSYALTLKKALYIFVPYKEVMKRYNLFLDDVREPTDCLQYKEDPRYGNLEWVIVRSHQEFISVVLEKWEQGAFPSLVSFDHDLAHEHYHSSMYEGLPAYESVYERMMKIPTGRRSADFLVKFCKEHGLRVPECLIHTMNPAGKQRIQNTLKKEKE
jgi:hypothetical protein